MKIKSVEGMIAGDIILTRSDSFVSKLIRWVTSMQTGDAQYSHVAMSLGRGLIIESLVKITVGKAEKYANQQIQVWRLPLTKEQRASFEVGMLETAGGAYGVTKLPLFLMDAIGTKISKIWGAKKPCFWFTKTFGITSIPVCSQLCVWGIEKKAGYDLLDQFGLEVNWKTVSPDYLQDLLKLPINKARLILEQ